MTRETVPNAEAIARSLQAPHHTRQQAPGPITLAPPHADIAPHAYVRMRYTQQCQCCGTIVEHTRLFTKTRIRHSLDGSMANGSMMRICDEPPRYNLPVITQNADLEILSICVHCTDEQITAHMTALPHVTVEPPKPADVKAEILNSDLVKNSPKFTRYQDAKGFWHTERNLDTDTRLSSPTTRESTPRIRTVDDLLAAISK